MNSIVSLLLILSSWLLFGSSANNAVHNKIYQPIDHFSSGFRILRGSSATGSGTTKQGNIGKLVVANNQTELELVLDSKDGVQLTVFINSTSILDFQTFTAIRNSGLVTNIILPALTQYHPSPDIWSADYVCPNIQTDFYTVNKTKFSSCSKRRFNPHGNNLKFVDWGDTGVIALTNITEIENLLKNCYEKFNIQATASDPYCAVRVNTFMRAAHSTPVCMRRTLRNQKFTLSLQPVSYCAPLRSRNLISYVPTPEKDDPKVNRSLYVVAARMDTFSIFEHLAAGASSPLSGVITLLVTSKLLRDALDATSQKANSTREVVFTFFEGEAFDYIGSSRLAYDIKHGAFSDWGFDNIAMFLEISQLLDAKAGKDLWLHTDPVSMNLSEIADTVNRISDIMVKDAQQKKQMTLTRTNSQQPLPPASVQSFLRYTPIPSLVLADHDSSYENPYYNSQFDKYNLRHTDSAKIMCESAGILARTLFKEITNQQTIPGGLLEADSSYCEEIYQCYTRDPNCTFFKLHWAETIAARFSTFNLKWYQRSFFVGTFPRGTSLIADAYLAITHSVLQFFSGEKLRNVTSSSECKLAKGVYYPAADRSKIWPNVNGSGVCVLTTTSLLNAESPAFIDESGADWDSKVYSTYTESYWDVFTVDYFLVPSRTNEIVTLVLGLVVCLVSFLLVFCIRTVF